MSKLNLPYTRTEQIVFADSMTLDGTKILTAMVTEFLRSG